MAVHGESAVRQRAVDIIQNARASQHVGGIPRLFKKPVVNWGANSCLELVQLDNLSECNPPVLKNILDLDVCVNYPEQVKARYLNFPCHSQRNEYYVQQTHLAVPLSADPRHIMGAVRLIERSRGKFPKLQSKKDFSHAINTF